MLVIGSSTVSPNCDLEDLLNNSSDGDVRKLAECSAEFSQLSAVTADRKNFLYIMQEEFCVVSSNDQIKYVGTSNSTTCHMLVMRHRSLKATVLAHVGCSDSLGLKTMIHRMQKLVGPTHENIDVYIVGGYLDEKGHSKKLTKWLINSLSNHNLVFNLVLACTGSVNTIVGEVYNLPKVTAVVVNLVSGEVRPAVIDETLFGPATLLRHARLYSSFRLYEIYNSSEGCVCLNRFGLKLPSSFSFLDILEDQEILEGFSTSPYAEGPSFLKDLKELKIFLTSHIAAGIDAFAGKEKLIFRLSASGDWVEI